MAIPKGWKRQVRLSVLQVISLAQFAMAYTRSWAANSPTRISTSEFRGEHVGTGVTPMVEETIGNHEMTEIS